MTATVGNAPKLSSGTALVDETWGGFYRGGSYLVYGRAESSRDVLPFLFAAETSPSGRCLYVSSDPSSGAATRAGELGIDLHRSGRVDLHQLSPAVSATGTTDDELASELSAVVRRAETTGPERIVVDTFMPFVRFESFGRFQAAFLDLLERVDAVDATLMIVLAEPANEASEAVIAFMRDQMTGAVHVEQPAGDESSANRLVSFLPGIGHAGLQVDKPWNVGPWIHPVSASGQTNGASRRFRFAERADTQPSPREARWDDVHVSRNERVASVPLGRTPEKLRAPDPHSTPGHGRPSASDTIISAVPLGRTRSPRSAPGASTLAATMHPQPALETNGLPARPLFRPMEVPEPDHHRSSTSNRDAFRSRLQQHFLRRGVDRTPFVLIAMRMDRPGERTARPFDFEFVLDLVTESLGDRDDVLVDLERERLIAMLAESAAAAPQQFFARLKHRLQEEAPQQAGHLLQSVSAIVVPNGEPFQNAEEFLSYALDEL